MTVPDAAPSSGPPRIFRAIIWLVIVVAGVGLLATAASGPLESLDRNLYDSVLRWQALRQPTEASRYLLVEIDDRSIEALGRFPWTRSAFAELFDRTAEGKAAVVGVDVLFAEPADSAGDAAMAEAMRRAGNVVLASVPVLSDTDGQDAPGAVGRLRPAEAVIPPIPLFEESAAAVGSISVLEDPDGSMRRYSLLVRLHGKPYPSLAQSMVSVLSGGEGSFTVRGDGTMLINYGSLSPAAIERVSFSDVLEMTSEELRALFGERIVMVAATYTGGVDVGPTPLATRTPSSVAHIYAVHTILSEERIRAAPAWVAYLLAILILGFFATQVPQRHPLQLLGVALVVAIGLLAVVGILFVSMGVFIGPALPVVAAAAFVSGYGLEQWWVANRNLRIRNRELEETLENLRRTRAEKARMEAELNVAREIQFSMLPQTFPPFPEKTEFDLYATLVPAREVGGDFYDFFLLDDDHLCFCVADVSGKGVSAALFMAVSKALMKSNSASDLSPSEIVSKTNDQLAIDNEASMFVTVWLAILDLRTGELRYSNAGHNPPFVLRKDGELVRIDKRHGPPVAAMEEIPFSDDRIELASGDYVILYTDGVSEAKNEAGELYGEGRLVESLNSSSGSTARDLVDRVAAAVWEYQGQAEQADDVTIVALHYRGADRPE